MRRIVDKRNLLLAEMEDVSSSVAGFTSELIAYIFELEVANQQLVETLEGILTDDLEEQDAAIREAIHVLVSVKKESSDE